ncbi:bone morphogenetic protein receptor type-1B-like [Planococcus citri]|uniref:bone morphogenetic protein receptor type-1B-like n=1 Tax=Planococcus citri TaxID=170843 RepID=UPI0031F7779A
MKIPPYSRNYTGIICYCISCPGEEEENSTCRLKEGAQCYAAVEEVFNPDINDYEPVYDAGCLGPDEQSTLQCEGDRVPSENYRSIKCCNFTDLCNKNLLSEYKPRTKITPPTLLEVNLSTAVIAFSIVFTVAVIISIMFLFYKYRKNNGSRKGLTKLSNKEPSKCNNNLHNFSHSSGSGDGQSLLTRRTIGREVRKEQFLGKGRFSEKWIVIWKEDRIVMKTFTTCEEEQWAREKSIYATGLNHVNVLGLIGSDHLKDGLRATFTYYCPNGSLHDYIKKHCLNDMEFLTLARSATNGVQILHKEIRGTCTRPSIVHRNITSKNFLVNEAGECVICDFEVALMESEKFDPKMDLRVGTPRYAAPEIVNETIHSFEGFKMADIYSLGLVLWEMCRRSVAVSQDYALPFADLLPKYPIMEDMKNIFATKKTVHEMLGIPITWEKDSILSTVTLIVKECTNENAKSRPTSVRISKYFSSWKTNEKKISMYQ